MTPYVRQEYARLRAKDWPAGQAWHAANVRARFRELDERGLVKLWVEADEMLFDDSYIDTWGLSPDKVKKEKEELWAKIGRDGVWILVGYFREDGTPGEWNDNWENGRHAYPPGYDLADSCGGFIGRDWRDSGYDVDIMEATMDAVYAAEAAKLAERATFATL